MQIPQVKQVNMMYLVSEEQYEYFKGVVGGQEKINADGKKYLILRGSPVLTKKVAGLEVKDVRDLDNDWELWTQELLEDVEVEKEIKKALKKSKREIAEKKAKKTAGKK